MKGIYVVCALALGLGVCAGASAAKKPTAAPVVQKWSKEPDSFLGIKFGAPSSVQACPTKMIGGTVIAGKVFPGITSIDFDAVKSLNGVCVDGTTSLGLLRNTPDLGFSYSVMMGTNDGATTDFTLTSDPSDFNTLAATFITRYGEPTNRAKSAVQTIGGATFENEVLQWQGEHVAIVMRKYADRVDRSETSILNEDYWGPKEKARSAAASAGVGKL